MQRHGRTARTKPWPNFNTTIRARAHGEIHHENRIIDLNSASEQEIADLPMVGPDRARALLNARPFHSWDDVRRISGFGPGMVDDLKSGGAQIGSLETDGASHD